MFVEGGRPSVPWHNDIIASPLSLSQPVHSYGTMILIHCVCNAELAVSSCIQYNSKLNLLGTKTKKIEKFGFETTLLFTVALDFSRA